MKIVITRKLPERFINVLPSSIEVVMWESDHIPMPREQLLAQIKEADALLTVLSDRIDRELLAAAPRLKIVSNLAVGYDNIDVGAATDLSIVVTNTPDVLTETTADLTFALLLATARRMGEGMELVKEDQWRSWSPFFLAGGDVHHKTVGIFGMGAIGQAVASRAKGFQMEVIYHNRNRRLEAEKALGATYVSFEELLRTSDFVVCLAPLTKETADIFNYEAFKQMKPTTYFINAGRGKVVVEEDLVKALSDKRIAGAGLDVFREEPIRSHHPLLQLKNVVALPHVGSASIDTRTKMIQLCLKNIERVVEGNSPLTPVKL
ncbi:2-hydroxyacid dehydrogenase [Bacillus coahuilensis]|uniref:2-hydroxyacid dehydrogenase n=1 Tax=Bacillus coahuilensis TaxID=408580 RepID=UPI0009E7ECB8|nr:D-glycerate dehydrogenase [Bacillus coahuilensis]